MPRPPRLVIPGQPHHVIHRGNNRSVMFVDDRDYVQYKNALRSAADRSSCSIHAYVLMSNHVHLLVTPSHENGAARLMQTLGGAYVRYFNDRHGRTGTLWEGRYRSTVIESSRYLLACSRYIELNPARAGMVADPGAYFWSSYRHNALGARDPLLTPHEVYRALADRSTERFAAYRQLFGTELEREQVEDIRRATNCGTILGSSCFCESLATFSPPRVNRGHRRRSPTPAAGL